MHFSISILIKKNFLKKKRSIKQKTGTSAQENKTLRITVMYDGITAEVKASAQTDYFWITFKWHLIKAPRRFPGVLATAADRQDVHGAVAGE